VNIGIVRVTPKTKTPAGELVVEGSLVKLFYDDYILMRIFRSLFSRSLCSKCVADGKTTKHLAKNKLTEVLRLVKRPYFFEDITPRNWKYSETLGATQHA
jgi:hypothetical protein